MILYESLEKSQAHAQDADKMNQHMEIINVFYGHYLIG